MQAGAAHRLSCPYQQNFVYFSNPVNVLHVIRNQVVMHLHNAVRTLGMQRNGDVGFVEQCPVSFQSPCTRRPSPEATNAGV